MIKPYRGFLLLPAVALLVVIAAACGGGDDSSNSGPAVAVATGSGGSGGSSAGQKIEVPPGAPEIDQDNLTFKPSKVTMKVGQKLYIKNSETAIHTANINGKNITGNMKKGDVVVWEAKNAGEYKVTCDYHPQMKATIVVEP